MTTIAEKYNIPFPIKNYTLNAEAEEFLTQHIAYNPPINLLENISCGWELEVEGLTGENQTIKFKKWPRLYFAAIEDGSLKDFGQEFVTRGPLKNQHLELSLLELDYYNKLLKTGFKFSHRCSFHVHLDVTDITREQLSTIIQLYILTEPLFFSLCENHRAGNSYCIPLGLLSLTKKELFSASLKDTKYWALSLNRISDLGTLEFRALHGTNDLKLLFTWIRLIQSLKQAVLENYKETISQIMNLTSSNDTQHFLSEIIPIQLVHKLPDLTRNLDESLFTAKYFQGNY